jgi:uncharacterized protein (DUF2062 family)
MFGRRAPLSKFDRLVAMMWPRRGLGRAGRYLVRRIERIKGSPHAIALGIAFGASVSFLPVPGLHLVLGGLLTFAFRGSLIGSAVGTIIGNPWTFPLIWIGSYQIGRWFGLGEDGAVTEGAIGTVLRGIFSDISSGRFAEAAVESWPVFGPTLFGGSVMAVFVWLLVYGLVRKVCSAYQTRRHAKLAEGRARWQRPAAIEATEKGSL